MWDWEKIGTAVMGMAGGLTTGLLLLRRRVSSDGLALTGDQANQTLIKNLREERDKYLDEARKAWDARLEDAKRIATLEAENRLLTHDMAELRLEIKLLTKQAEKFSRQLNPQSRRSMAADKEED